MQVGNPKSQSGLTGFHRAAQAQRTWRRARWVAWPACNACSVSSVTEQLDVTVDGDDDGRLRSTA